MNIDQRALRESAVERDNDSPTYRILHNPTSPTSEVSCCEKNSPPPSVVVDDIDKGSKSSYDFEKEYDGIQNVKPTGSDYVGDHEAVKNQDDTFTLRFIEKVKAI